MTNYYKVGLITVLCVLLTIFVKNFFFPAKPVIKVDTDKISLSSSTINIPIEVFSPRDLLCRINFYIKEDNERKPLIQNIVVALKKGQNYSFFYKIDESELKQKNLFVLTTETEELLPKKKKYISTNIIKLAKKEETLSLPAVTPEQKISTHVIETPILTKEKQIVTEKPVVEKIVKKELPKEEINFEISISTYVLKNKYNYDDKIKVAYIVFNKSKLSSITPEINLSIKNNFDVSVISNSYTLGKVSPLQSVENYDEFNIPKNITPDSYYIELTATYKNVTKKIVSDKFNIVDTPPKIALPEPPTIKYKLTNTIIAEVEDDREIQDVVLVETEPKKKKETKYTMVLIAGNKKAGLYSCTTQKIIQKNIYSFYIQATDISGNTTKTELYQIKVQK